MQQKRGPRRSWAHLIPHRVRRAPQHLPHHPVQGAEGADPELLKNVGLSSFPTNGPSLLQHLISTVDRYKGDENDFIILSLVRVRPGNRFVALQNRFVVAMSRARIGFVMIGARRLSRALHTGTARFLIRGPPTRSGSPCPSAAPATAPPPGLFKPPTTSPPPRTGQNNVASRARSSCSVGTHAVWPATHRPKTYTSQSVMSWS